RAIPDSAFFVEDIVTPGKVMAKLKNLSSDKSAGIDQVATHALKMCAEVLAGPLATIFVESLRSSTLAVEWK
ncbi:hypothetical protein BpHYR1_019673, partial [Brachionus plicatilis]